MDVRIAPGVYQRQTSHSRNLSLLRAPRGATFDREKTVSGKLHFVEPRKRSDALPVISKTERHDSCFAVIQPGLNAFGSALQSSSMGRSKR